MTKILDTEAYVSVLRELTEQGQEVSMIVAGGSMLPFLAHDRDMILFQKPDRQLRCGDMVFYQRPNGRFVMHRICRITADGYYMIGDAQTLIEGPLPEQCIFAYVTQVRRKGKWIDDKDFWWRFFEKIWIRIIPLRRFLVDGYCFVKRLLGK